MLAPTCIYTYVYTHTFKYIYIQAYIHVYAYTHICIYAHMRTYIKYGCPYACIYIHSARSMQSSQT